MAIELDGAVHFSSAVSEYDARRTTYLKSLNIRVLRFENNMVFENLDGVLKAIKRYLLSK